MAEVDEHPHMAGIRPTGSRRAVHKQLQDYATRLVRQHGLTISPSEVRVACVMLQGSLFADAMGRDIMADLYPRPKRAGAEYARAFLRMLGMEPGSIDDTGDDTAADTHNGGRAAARATGRNGHARQARRPRGT